MLCCTKTSDPTVGTIGIDNLSYGYQTNSNKLALVYDSSNNTSGFNDGNTTGDDYTYDDNGNLTTDKNKEITSISYNYLNLPTEINFGSSFIRYIYDALGTKLKKIVLENTDRTETCYAGGFQYVQYFEGGLPSVLQFFSQPEGYVEPDGRSFKYVYQYKDHLGNVRLSYKDLNGDGAITNNEIVEESNYYPFGLTHNGYNNTITSYNPGQKYRFNGQEYQDELGLNFYDYGARNYDPAIGRWMNIDPLAEKSRRWSPYNYCLNNPVFYIDPDGMEAVTPEKFDYNQPKINYNESTPDIASPIYGTNGQFLGTDSEGFKGEVLFISESTFGVFGQGMSHGTALMMGQTLNEVMGSNPETDFTQSEANMVNNAITDVVSKTGDKQFSASNLKNGSTSIYYASPTISESDGNKYFTIESNGGNPYTLGNENSPASMGGNTMTYNLTSSLWSKGQFTVNNIQNASIHEGNGHFMNGVPGEGKAHMKAYQMQMTHSSWEGTTPA